MRPGSTGIYSWVLAAGRLRVLPRCNNNNPVGESEGEILYPASAAAK
jgi:hypothetical protein